MTEVQIIMPNGALGASESDGFLDTAMRLIGVGFGDPDEWASKYGTNFENEVFLMKTQYWGDCTCGAMDTGPDEPERDCEPTCPMQAPNFRFKPTGFEVRWYKYIGRDMEFSGELPADFIQQIFAIHPKGMTVDQASSELARGEEENARAFQAMFNSLGM